MRYSYGFSLLELLITLTIIGILASFCFPIYSQHIASERRLEAKIALEKLAADLEKYYITHNTYQGATLENLGFSPSIAAGQYQLAITTTENTFSLAAVPAQQDKCGTLTVDSTGKKATTGTDSLSDCW